MSLPKDLLDALEGIPGFDRHSMEEVHRSDERISSIRINPLKPSSGSLFPEMQRVPWSDYGYYLPSRPSYTLDPRFHAGGYYVQEASGMFLEQAMKQTLNLAEELICLDLCGAPGGKSTHIQSLISENSLLVSNEVIKSRAEILEENIIKWGAGNVVVTNNDPSDFSGLKGFFDLIVVDAPCSGSGLFRREPGLISEWSLNNVKLCCQRQQRILSDILPSLAEGGVLIYSTCSYSKEEDEDITHWLIKEGGLEGVRLKLEDHWGIVESSTGNGGWGYRFFPDKIKGEGFYLSCFRKTHEIKWRGKSVKIKKANEKFDLPQNFILPEDFENLVLFGDRILMQNRLLREALPELKQHLYIRKAGISVGKPSPKGLIPDHELAVSPRLSPEVVDIPLNLEQALQYLRKDTFTLSLKSKGWATVSYYGFRLGWIKLLQGRLNNYYPTTWRILK